MSYGQPLLTLEREEGAVVWYGRGLTELLILADGRCESLVCGIGMNRFPRLFCFIQTVLPKPGSL